MLTGVAPPMRILREESFGPVLSIVVVKDMDEAIALANDSDYGLAASVWSADLRQARRWAEQLEVGGVVINDCLVHFAIPALPFGGVKQSGFGRSQGQQGLLEFCAAATITTHQFGPTSEVHWFPYRDRWRWMARFTRWLHRSGWARFWSSDKL